MNKRHNFSDKNIIVIGDAMLDIFVYGKSSRKSPEHPVDVIKIEEKKYYLGGAANVAANIIGLGAKARLLSVLGKDANAKKLLDMLEEIHCPIENLLIDPKRPTTVKSRIFSDDHPVCRLDEESDAYLSQDLEALLMKHLNGLIADEKADGIILQDYNKGCLSEELIKAIMACAKSNDIPVFVDPKFNNLGAFNGAAILKPNLAEISAFLGYKPEISMEGLDEAAEKLKNYVDHDILIITLSEKGAYFRCKSHGKLVQTNPISKPDVCGAGDSFISAVSLAAVSNYDSDSCVEFATKCSTLACTKSGVYAIKINELISE